MFKEFLKQTIHGGEGGGRGGDGVSGPLEHIQHLVVGSGKIDGHLGLLGLVDIVIQK